MTAPAPRWLGPLAVVSALLVTALGGHVLASALREPTGDVVRIAGLEVRPLSGWATAGSGTAGGWSLVRLTRGTATMDVGVRAPGRSIDPGVVALDYVEAVLRPGLSRLSVSEVLEPAAVGGSGTGVRFSYAGVHADTGVSIEGEVTVVPTAAGGVAFDARAPAGQIAFALDDVRTMIGRASVVGVP